VDSSSLESRVDSNNVSTRSAPLGTRLVVAHAIAVLLALLDLITPSVAFDPDGEFAPGTAGILTLGALGLFTLVGVGAHLATRRRGWLRVVAAIRTISALTAVPAFVVEGVPAAVVLGAAICVGLTVVDVVLLLSPRKPRP
jgi:hypothetical protein